MDKRYLSLDREKLKESNEIIYVDWATHDIVCRALSCNLCGATKEFICGVPQDGQYFIHAVRALDYLASLPADAKDSVIEEALSNLVEKFSVKENINPLEADEPFFILYGRDVTTPEMILKWLAKNSHLLKTNPAKARSAFEQAMKCAEYKKTKTPD